LLNLLKNSKTCFVLQEVAKSFTDGKYLMFYCVLTVNV
jgi:hypothetical protein